MMLKHRSNVQGNEENSNRKPVFNKSVSIKCLSESVNIATVKRLLLKSETNTETETNFRILQIYYIFCHKNVRVGGIILGSVGRSETHIFFFLPYGEQFSSILLPQCRGPSWSCIVAEFTSTSNQCLKQLVES